MNASLVLCLCAAVTVSSTVGLIGCSASTPTEEERGEANSHQVMKGDVVDDSKDDTDRAPSQPPAQSSSSDKSKNTNDERPNNRDEGHIRCELGTYMPCTSVGIPSGERECTSDGLDGTVWGFCAETRVR
jgi:hypothetical protein